jgi:predicted metal-binding membrane protein
VNEGVAATRDTLIEAALKRDRALVLSGLLLAVALSWLYLVLASRDMYGPMDGLSAWMMTGAWDAQYGILIAAMWVVMMIGMMLPSAAPAILLYSRILRGSAGASAPVARTYAFMGGYLLAWIGFSLLATVLQGLLAKTLLLSPMMQSAHSWLSAALLMVAAIYQLTPLKQTCLGSCRSPAEFLTRNWRPGIGGAMRLGVHHGLYCVGCCWALMLLLFAGGVMSLLWIGAITLYVLAEKLLPRGVQGSRWAGALLLLMAIYLAVDGR